MPAFPIVFVRRSEKSLREAPAHIRKRLVRAIDALSTDPRPIGVKTLSSATKLYRVRVGPYRIVYQVQDARLVVLVVRVGDRKEVYRRLDILAKRFPPP